MIEHYYNNHRNQTNFEQDNYDTDEGIDKHFILNDGIYENGMDSSKNGFNSNCKLYEMRVPFQLVPKLVASRSVVLKKGFADLLCHHFEHLMKQVFINLIQDKLTSYLQSEAYVPKVMNNQIEDERTRNLFKFLISFNTQMKDVLSITSPKCSARINLRNISRESEYFPKCMKNIYGILEKGEKLSHNQRFNFSLFLKDVGMQMQEATNFWRKYYSKINGQTHRSLSIWEERRSKYNYSVKHLYGQTGSGGRYNTASCSSLHSQSLCPFSNTG